MSSMKARLGPKFLCLLKQETRFEETQFHVKDLKNL